MQQTIRRKHILNAPSAKVWANISKGTGVNEWLPVITACRLDGDKRICTTDHGDMNETILDVDHANRIFRYAINSQPLLPVTDVIGTMQVLDEEGKTTLLWKLDFSLENEELLPMVQQAVEGTYAAGADGLQTISQ